VPHEPWVMITMQPGGKQQVKLSRLLEGHLLIAVAYALLLSQHLGSAELVQEHNEHRATHCCWVHGMEAHRRSPSPKVIRCCG
jgi:hypothetical protein